MSDNCLISLLGIGETILTSTNSLNHCFVFIRIAVVVSETVVLIKSFLLLQAKLLENSHAWLGASTSSIAGQLMMFQISHRTHSSSYNASLFSSLWWRGTNWQCYTGEIYLNWSDVWLILLIYFLLNLIFGKLPVLFKI